MDFKKLAGDAESYVLDRRHWYHSHPELSGQEFETRVQIHKDLEALGITDIRETEEHCGLIATIHGAKPGKTIALRADIDALPVVENTGLEFASTVEGRMHACGHDAHTAILLCAAKILNEHKDQLCGNVRLIFQPSEETGEGAPWMIEAGALDGVDAIYGNHIWGKLESGKFDITAGARMAYAGHFDIYIDGQMAHGSAPHLGADAIVAGSAVLVALQQYASRINNPLDPFVLTAGVFNGGPRYNIIPNWAFLEGNVRSFHAENHIEIMTRIIEHTAAAYGCKARMVYKHVMMPVYNNSDELNGIAKNAAAEMFGADRIAHLPVELGSEDFAWYSEKVPSFFTLVGSRDESKGLTATNHQAEYTMDEAILKDCVALMTRFAYDYLELHKND